MRPSEAAVLDVIDSVFDPCSVSVGVPLNIRDMGLFTGLDLGEDGSVHVRMRLTTPGCFEGITKFSHDIETGVSAIEGVTSVSVEFADGCDWSEADISEEGRRLLGISRAAARARFAETQVQIASPPAEANQ